MVAEAENNSVLVGMQIQLGEIKGILNTIVQEHARRIGDTETTQRQMRFDLDAVKTEAKKDVTDLANTLNAMALKSTEDAGKILQNLNEGITTNKNNIIDLRSDLAEVKEKQNSFWPKIWPPLAIVVTSLALIWNVLGK